MSLPFAGHHVSAIRPCVTAGKYENRPIELVVSFIKIFARNKCRLPETRAYMGPVDRKADWQIAGVQIIIVYYCVNSTVFV